VKSVQVGTLMCLLSVGCLAQQPVPPSGTNANVVSIHTIDFRNFDYPANCWKDVDDYPKVIHVSNGGWEKTLKNGSIIGFSLAKPVFGYVTGGPQEDAVVSGDCELGEGMASEVFVYKVVGGKLQLTKVPTSAWEEHPKELDWYVSGVRINNKQLLVTYVAGGSHAQPAWDVTSTLQWNGSKFIRIKTVRVPHK
jgi:hypothetical protein